MNRWYTIVPYSVFFFFFLRFFFLIFLIYFLFFIGHEFSFLINFGWLHFFGWLFPFFFFFFFFNWALFLIRTWINLYKLDFLSSHFSFQPNKKSFLSIYFSIISTKHKLGKLKSFLSSHFFIISTKPTLNFNICILWRGYKTAWSTKN